MTALSPDDLVEKVARALQRNHYEGVRKLWPGWPVDKWERERWFSQARAALAALPDISSLQGEIDRLRKLLDNSSQSQPVLTPSGQPSSEPSGGGKLMPYDRTGANPIYEGATHYERSEDGAPCDCGSFMDRATVTDEEEMAFGCGRRGCCSRAFVCRVCGKRARGWAYAPEME